MGNFLGKPILHDNHLSARTDNSSLLNVQEPTRGKCNRVTSKKRKVGSSDSIHVHTPHLVPDSSSHSVLPLFYQAIEFIFQSEPSWEELLNCGWWRTCVERRCKRRKRNDYYYYSPRTSKKLRSMRNAKILYRILEIYTNEETAFRFFKQYVRVLKEQKWESKRFPDTANASRNSSLTRVSDKDSEGTKKGYNSEKQDNYSVGSVVKLEMPWNPRAGIQPRQRTQPENLDASSEKPMYKMVGDRLLKQTLNNRAKLKGDNSCFYRKVVAHRKTSTVSLKGPYYYVVHYEAMTNKLTLIELVPDGSFLGRHRGCTKWRAIGRDVEDKQNLLKVVNGSDYEVIPAVIISKMPCIHEESWNILD